MSQKTSKEDNKYSLCLNLLLKNEEKPRLIHKAILPELNAKHVKRSKTSILIKNRTISINIKAKDTAAMRAAANSSLNSIILAKTIMEV